MKLWLVYAFWAVSTVAGNIAIMNATSPTPLSMVAVTLLFLLGAFCATGATATYGVDRPRVPPAIAARDAERAIYLPEALREVDRLLPWTEPVAPTKWEAGCLPESRKAVQHASGRAPWKWWDRVECGVCRRAVDTCTAQHRATTRDVKLSVRCHGETQELLVDDFDVRSGGAIYVFLKCDDDPRVLRADEQRLIAANQHPVEPAPHIMANEPQDMAPYLIAARRARYRL